MPFVRPVLQMWLQSVSLTHTGDVKTPKIRGIILRDYVASSGAIPGVFSGPNAIMWGRTLALVPPFCRLMWGNQAPTPRIRVVIRGVWKGPYPRPGAKRWPSPIPGGHYGVLSNEVTRPAWRSGLILVAARIAQGSALSASTGRRTSLACRLCAAHPLSPWPEPTQKK